MVYGELGRYPLFVNSTLRCLKYWLLVLKMDDIRIPKQAYKMMILIDEREKKCWVTQVKNVLSKNGFYCFWFEQGVGDDFFFFFNFFNVNWNRDLQTILFKTNGMQLFEIKTDTFHTAMLSQYLNQSNTFQPLKYIASELDCANCDLVCYQLTTTFIATVLVRSREIV